MTDVVDRLKRAFRDPDYRLVYDDGFLNSSLATQIKVLREERGWTQTELATRSEMNQSRVSELEDVNFNSWTIRTLRKLAKAFDLRLKISFEEFGTLLVDFRNLNRKGLSRKSFCNDPVFQTMVPAEAAAAKGDSSVSLPQMPRQNDFLFASPGPNGNENGGATALGMGSATSGNNSRPPALHLLPLQGNVPEAA